MKSGLSFLPFAGFVFLGNLLVNGETIVDDDFDDGSVTGWQSLGNTLGATHSITESGTLLTSRVVSNPGNLNTHRGIVSTVSFDPVAEGSAGISMTFVVSSQGTLTPGANGMFLGLTSSDSLFFRTTGTTSFGLTFFGHASRTRSNNGVSLVTNDLETGGSATEGLILDSNPNSLQLESFQDGFTATIHMDPVGWSYTVFRNQRFDRHPGNDLKSRNMGRGRNKFRFDFFWFDQLASPCQQPRRSLKQHSHGRLRSNHSHHGNSNRYRP